jgi:hypothetical protein
METKAEIKRRKEKETTIRNRVLPEIEPFHNYYLAEVLKWELKQIVVAAHKYGVFNTYYEMRDEMAGKTHKEYDLTPSRYATKNAEGETLVSPDDVYKLWKVKEAAMEQRKYEAITSLAIMTKTENGYQQKISDLVAKMVELDFHPWHITVKEINITLGQLEILIWDDGHTDLEFHARSIWAEGAINAPHYRFITTIRGKGTKLR